MVMHCAECLVEYRDGFTVCADCGERLSSGEPPSPNEDDAGELVTVFESRDSSMLAIAASVLREAGIRFVERSATGRGSLAGVFGYNPAAGPRRLCVAEADAAEAREVLEQTAEAAGETSAIPDPDELDNEIVQIETNGWDALSSSVDDARDFYRDVLHDDCVMLFPGGMLLEGRDVILESFSAQPWDDFEISDARTVWLGPEAVAVVYRVRAHREGSPYEALISSTYVMTDGEWKLAVHQQTPVR